MKIGELLKHPKKQGQTTLKHRDTRKGGQGLRDEEAKGGNAARKIQKVLSWLEGNCMTIFQCPALCQYCFQVLHC